MKNVITTDNSRRTPTTTHDYRILFLLGITCLQPVFFPQVVSKSGWLESSRHRGGRRRFRRVVRWWWWWWWLRWLLNSPLERTIYQEGQTDRSTDRHRLNRQARLNKVASESFVRSRNFERKAQIRYERWYIKLLYSLHNVRKVQKG